MTTTVHPEVRKIRIFHTCADALAPRQDAVADADAAQRPRGQHKSVGMGLGMNRG
jgi:hypothetical protein